MTEAVVLAVVVGLVVGSFLTVVSSRVPEGESVVTPRSRCPSCGVQLRAVDLVPVVSYLVQRGRCRGCRAPIGARYPLVELATGAAFGVVTARVPTLWVAPAFCVLAAGLVALTAVDLERHRLPTPVIYVTGAVGIPLLVLGSLPAHGGAGPLLRIAVGAAIAFALFGLIFFVAPGGMGFGDVRLATLCGAFLGWLGYRVLAASALVAFVSAGLVAIALVATRLAGRKTALPFGPFLALGAVVGVAAGVPIAHAWLG